MKLKRTYNALKNGVYAQETVLPWEDPAEFASFEEAIRNELQPVGPLEEEAVHEVADLHWRKHRLRIGALLSYYKDAVPPELAEAAKGGVRGLAEYLNKTQTGHGGTIHATGAQILSYIKARIAAGAEGATQPILPTTPTQSPLERAYDPVAMMTYLKAEAAIDARISKALARLVALKDYKIIYTDERGSRSIDAPPVCPDQRGSAQEVETGATTDKGEWIDITRR